MKHPFADIETLPELIAFVEAKLPGWGWLLRNCRANDDNVGQYFSNITSPEFQTHYLLKGGRVIDHADE